MENQEVSGLVKARARMLSHVIETVLGRIPSYDDLQQFTRAVFKDDPLKEIILYNNQAIGVIEISPVKKHYSEYTAEVKFNASFNMADDMYEYCL